MIQEPNHSDEYPLQCCTFPPYNIAKNCCGLFLNTCIDGGNQHQTGRLLCWHFNPKEREPNQVNNWKRFFMNGVIIIYTKPFQFVTPVMVDALCNHHDCKRNVVNKKPCQDDASVIVRSLIILSTFIMQGFQSILCFFISNCCTFLSSLRCFVVGEVFCFQQSGFACVLVIYIV